MAARLYACSRTASKLAHLIRSIPQLMGSILAVRALSKVRGLMHAFSSGIMLGYSPISRHLVTGSPHMYES